MIQSIFNKNKIPLYLVSLALVHILYFLYLDDLKFFIFLIYSMRGVMGLVIMVIAINTYKISHNKIFTFLAVSLGFSGIIDSLSVLITYHYSLGSILSEHIYIRMLGDFFNILSLIVCCKLYNKDFNLRSVFIFYSSIVLSLIVNLTLSLFIFEFFPPIDSVVLLNLTIRDMLNFILIILSVYPIYAYSQIKNDMEDNDLKIIFLLSLVYTISSTLFFLSSFADFLIFLADVILLFHLFFMCVIILNSVLKKPYEMLFYDLDRKSKEAKKIKDYYETVIESLPLSIIVMHDNNKVSFTNLTGLELFNYKSISDVYNMDLYDLLDDQSIADFADNIYNKVLIFKTTFKKSDGDTFDAKVTPANVVFNDKECTMLIIKDISAKKMVRELSQTLEQKMLEEKMHTEFFSNVSHELRTPINVIYSVLQLEDIHIKNGDLEAIKKHNKTLKQNCLRLLRICNNLIDSSKIEAGYFIPDMKCSNMVDLIENIVTSVSTYTSIKNMTIVFDTDSEEIYSVCDSDLIERIILNLISNSIKYGSDGGSMWVDMYDEGDFVKIIFKDDGPGIPKEKCKDIFKRFIQVDRSLSRPSEGSGVGLALVKSLVDLHNGTIEIESEKGKGCKLTIMLPAVKYYLDEIAVASDSYLEDNSIIDKINIEFSDIYF